MAGTSRTGALLALARKTFPSIVRREMSSAADTPSTAVLAGSISGVGRKVREKN